MGKLDNKVALITGSDSGIGQATAIEFAKEGAKVVITYYSDEEGAQETLKKVEAAGSNGLVLQVDVTEEKEVERMFDKAIEKFERVDILMNNAAVNGQGIKVADMSTEVWDTAMKTNVYGYFFCTRRFINQVRKQGGKAKIINVSSVHEEIPAPGTAEYCATKGAVRNFTRVLALELAEEGINVNNIAPGMILTPMNEEAVEDKEVRKDQVQHIPMKRAGKPEEIGKLAVFLASSDSDYVTGSTYPMDGGLMQSMGQGA
ncbi:glucose 1-dehydrogenase [Salinimicrobium sediminis]|uniref:Glucose 1-dehydrogenase n=1 Tax=Salinimicrobium sediminis TaxID=1343891 RepID=A0A285X2J3_9FLAO|nr:SDR family oxidoreductase [Salinimicrobium sediminis]SOC79580.1 glucose 1-dehydrogenase [Salinimicrobium sediminis]